MKCLLGRNGFIGSELAKRFGEFSVIPAKDCDSVFYFAAPSSVILFNKNLSYCMRETINSFIEILDFCRETGAYLVYPSSATVYNKNNAYARCKAILEELQASYDVKALGLRISGCYGPNEGHKGEYASVIYQWCQLMKEGKSPVIWGDGTQTRDFIYIDDVIDAIMELSDEKTEGIVDIGTGVNTSMNEIVQIINEELGTDIKPTYIGKPKGFIQDTPVRSYTYKVSLREGIKKCLNQN